MWEVFLSVFVPVSLCSCVSVPLLGPPAPPPTNGKVCQAWEDFPHMLSHAIYGNACSGAEIVGCETRRHRQAVHDPQCCPQTGVMYGKTFHMGVSMARPVSELCLSPYASARLPVSLSPCVPVSLCPCLPVSLSLSPCVPVAVYLCRSVPVFKRLDPRVNHTCAHSRNTLSKNIKIIPKFKNSSPN